MKINLTSAQVKNAALVAAGIAPSAMAIKPGTKVQKDRKQAAKRGYEKHRSKFYC